LPKEKVFSSIADFTKNEHSFWKKEQGRRAKECLLRAEWGGKLQKPGANRPLVCYTDRNIATG
jgi:hypothetical protein